MEHMSKSWDLLSEGQLERRDSPLASKVVSNIFDRLAEFGEMWLRSAWGLDAPLVHQVPSPFLIRQHKRSRPFMMASS